MSDLQHHTDLIAAELLDMGIPARILRPGKIQVNYRRRACTSLELTRALLEYVEDGLITCSSAAGAGFVTING